MSPKITKYNYKGLVAKGCPGGSLGGFTPPKGLVLCGCCVGGSTPQNKFGVLLLRLRGVTPPSSLAMPGAAGRG